MSKKTSMFLLKRISAQRCSTVSVVAACETSDKCKNIINRNKNNLETVVII